MKLKKQMKRMSLQWRLTLMAAAVTALACVLLTVIMGRSANTRIDELMTVLVEEEDGSFREPASLDQIEIEPGVYERFENSKQRFNMQCVWVMAVIIAVSSLLTYFIAGKALRQLSIFSERIERIQAQNLSSPLDSGDFPKEISRLSDSFNKMLGRLSDSFDAQKQFSANAAHELRTPLAVMQTKIDVFNKSEGHSCEAYDELFGMLERQTDRLSQIVNELLEMTTLQTVERTDEIALAELAEEVLCDLEYQAQERHVQLIQGSGEAKLMGNDALIYRAVFNLVENAIKYNQPDGHVTVSIECEDSRIRLVVADTGIGIPKEYQSQIFEPFFRVDKSRSREMGGAGIGLAMVETIAELHGGRAYVRKSQPGESEIVLEFLSENREI